MPSHTGAHYFLTIIDDYSHTTRVYLMLFKLEAYTFLKRICIMIKTQFGCSVRHIHISCNYFLMKMELLMSELLVKLLNKLE